MTAVDNFLLWCELNDEEDTGDPEDFDLLVCTYVQHLYDTMRSESEAKRLRSALVFLHPSLRNQLGLTDRALLGWHRLEPARSWPPITYGLAVAAASALWMTEDYSHAAAILLAFECYLRNSETCNLRICDIALPGDPRRGRRSTLAAIALQKTKTGDKQWVTIRDPLVIHVLRYFISGPPTGKLFPGISPASFRRKLRYGLWLIGFEHSPYVVHSLRHGGAVRDYLYTPMTLEDVLRRGRWRSVATTRRYLQTTRSILLDVHIPEEAARASVYLEQERFSTFFAPHLPN